MVDVCSSDSGWFVSHRVVHLFICKGVCARVCDCVEKREKGDERDKEYCVQNEIELICVCVCVYVCVVCGCVCVCLWVCVNPNQAR